MSKRNKAPSTTWDDDDARTVFDDSPLKGHPNPRTQSTDALPLPDLGSLTNAWREHNHTTAHTQHPIQLTSHEQPGVPNFDDATEFSQLPQTKEPMLSPIDVQQNNASHHTPQPRRTQLDYLPFGADATTSYLTPEDILEADEADEHGELDLPMIDELALPMDEEPSTHNTPLTDEHPTSPGQHQHKHNNPHGYNNPHRDNNTHPYNAPNFGQATPVKGPAIEHQVPNRTSPYLSQMTFPGEQTDQARYQLQGPIAKGGMSLISRAFDRFFLRQNAMKILDGQLAQDFSHIQRFLEEAQITGQLGHPNIVPVYDIGIGQAGQHFFTMKLIRGQTLKEYITDDPFSPENEADIYRVLQIFLRVCDAVSYAHSRGVIHRDLKPSNIMVGSHGQVYVMDWGIAYLRSSQQHTDGKGPDDGEGPIQLQRDPTLSPAEIEGDIVGTWNYMAPEQAQGKTDLIGEHTDIFALGAILYEILTNAPPYEHESIYALLQQAQQGQYTHPQERAPHIHLPLGLCHIAMRAMHIDPTQRYPSVEALQQDIELFLRGGDQLPQRQFAAGTLIIQEGDPGHEAYVIARGHCRVFKTVEGRKVTLREMIPGEVFGETSIFLDQQRTASVEAIDDVTLVIVARDTLEQKLQNDTWLGRFVHTLANRFVDVDHKVTQLQQQLRQERITNQILAHLQTHGVPTSKGQTAAWNPLAEGLLERLQIPYEELIHTIQQLPSFQLDLDHNHIILMHK